MDFGFTHEDVIVNILSMTDPRVIPHIVRHPYALHTAEFLPECPAWEGLPFETEWTHLN